MRLMHLEILQQNNKSISKMLLTRKVIKIFVEKTR